jgi:hypothetical protein
LPPGTALYPFLRDREGEEATQHTEKMVVTARTESVARLQKIVDQGIIDCFPTGDVTTIPEFLEPRVEEGRNEHEVR